MDPDRKRQIRLVVALSAAVLLAVGLVYTSFSASSEAIEPSQLLAKTDTAGENFDVTGKVVDGSVVRAGNSVTFEVGDRDNPAETALPVRFEGQVPDPFREGREVIVKGELVDGTFVADQLITKCPSKFQEERTITTESS